MDIKTNQKAELLEFRGWFSGGSVFINGVIYGNKI